jgi:hypothetical protein
MRDEFLIFGKPDIGPEEIRYRAVHLHPYYLRTHLVTRIGVGA